MLFLALSSVVFTISIVSCFSKTPPKVANSGGASPDKAKPVKKEKKASLPEVTATPKTEKQASKVEILKPSPQNEDVKNQPVKKQDAPTSGVKTALLDGKEGKKLPPPPPPPSKPDHKQSSYAGMHEKSALKPPAPKLPSVITIPTKTSEATAKPIDSPKKPSVPKEPKKLLFPLIQDKTDDTIDDIPSVRVKDGVSYEGDGAPLVALENQKTSPKPGEGKRKSSKESVETMKSVEGEKK